MVKYTHKLMGKGLSTIKTFRSLPKITYRGKKVTKQPADKSLAPIWVSNSESIYSTRPLTYKSSLADRKKY